MLLQQANGFFDCEFYKHAIPILWGEEEYASSNNRGSNYLWIAEINYFRPLARSVKHFPGFPAVAIAKTKSWYRGVLLIPPIVEPLDRIIGGSTPLAPVDLTGWTDPVAQALHSTDLRLGDEPELTRMAWPMPRTEVSFKLYFESAATYGLLLMDHDYRGPLPMRRLQIALLECVYYLVERYNHPELTEFVEREKDDFEWLRDAVAKLEQEANNKSS